MLHPSAQGPDTPCPAAGSLPHPSPVLPPNGGGQRRYPVSGPGCHSAQAARPGDRGRLAHSLPAPFGGLSEWARTWTAPPDPDAPAPAGDPEKAVWPVPLSGLTGHPPDGAGGLPPAPAPVPAVTVPPPLLPWPFLWPASPRRRETQSKHIRRPAGWHLKVLSFIPTPLFDSSFQCPPVG